MKKINILILSFLMLLTLNSCEKSSGDSLNIYNVGEYLDLDLIDEFEQEYGVSVNYTTFDSNETAITKMQSDSYDLVVLSDYAVEQASVNDMIKPIDWSRIEGFNQNMLVSSLYGILNDLKEEENGFDFLKYSVPYFFGKVGICYDKNKVSEEDILEGFKILHNEKYDGQVAYYDSSRDGFMVAYKELGYSMNTTSLSETEEAFSWIKEIRKTVNCAFKTDELLSEMPDGKYAISLMYSGDAIYSMMEENDDVDLDFYVPDCGTNFFCDGMVIPSTVKNEDLAYKFISFMLRHDNAKANSIYVGYSSPIESVYNELVMPGEEFSVEQATLPYTEENGYVAGSAYENGQIVESIGGGLCQVSTTLYNAVLYAELEVTRRAPHSMSVSYVEPSRDAMIAEGISDFKFVNNYDTPILIEGYIDGNNQLGFYIYGKDTRAAGHSVEFESETLETTEYTKKYVEDTESAVGSQETEGAGMDGSTARLWKVTYENGEEVSREVINNSTYQTSDVTVKVGTKSDNAEATKLVEEAIATQDQEKINAAISKASALK